MTTTTTNDVHERAMAAVGAALNQRRTEGPRFGKPEEFPRIPTSDLADLIERECAVSPSKAKVIVRELRDAGRLYRTGDGTAIRYTTPEVHDAWAADTIDVGRRIEAVDERLVALGLFKGKPYHGTVTVTDSKGNVTYVPSGRADYGWSIMEAVLGKAQILGATLLGIERQYGDGCGHGCHPLDSVIIPAIREARAQVGGDLLFGGIA